MNDLLSRRRLGGLVAFVVLTLSAAACSIPTEDRPQPITREQTTTVAPAP